MTAFVLFFFKTSFEKYLEIKSTCYEVIKTKKRLTQQASADITRANTYLIIFEASFAISYAKGSV